MNQLRFIKPGPPIDEHVIALNKPINNFIHTTPKEIHQKKVASYAQNASGTIVAGIFGSFNNKCFFIQGLWVNNKVRKQGVGKKLVSILESYLLDKNINRVILETNYSQLVSFYLKNNYKIVQSINTGNSKAHYILEKLLI